MSQFFSDGDGNTLMAGGGATLLGELLDVDTSSKTDGYVLTYDSTLGKTRFEALPASATTISALTDVDSANIADGTIFAFNAGKWRPIKTTTYVIELNRWGIKNDGTDPINTTQGINNALVWASQQDISYVKLPAGNYLIAAGSASEDFSATACINLQSNMVFDLNGCTLVKQTNSWQTSRLMSVEGKKNVILRGGVLRGDRLTHGYSDASIAEWAMGVVVSGKVNNFLMENVEVRDFPGYSISLGGDAEQLEFWEDSDWNATTPTGAFEVGTINKTTGVSEADSYTLRLKNLYRLDTQWYTDRLNRHNGDFYIGANGYNSYGNTKHGEPLPLTKTVFTFYFYNNSGTYLGSIDRRSFDELNISLLPVGATQFKIAFPCDPNDILWLAVSLNAASIGKGITIRGCNIHASNALGVSCSALQYLLIEQNQFYDIGNYSTGFRSYPFPMAIDFEDGYEMTQHIVVRNNEFKDNKALHINIVQGRNFLIEGNKFDGSGGVGFQGSKASNHVSQYNEYTCSVASGESNTYMLFNYDHFTGNGNPMSITNKSTYNGCVFDNMSFITYSEGLSTYGVGGVYDRAAKILPPTQYANGYYYVCSTASGVATTTIPTAWPTSGTMTDSVGNVWTPFVYNLTYGAFTFQNCEFNENRLGTLSSWTLRNGYLNFDNCKFNIMSGGRYFQDDSRSYDLQIKNEIIFRDCVLNIKTGFGSMSGKKIVFDRCKLVGTNDNTWQNVGLEAKEIIISDCDIDSLDMRMSGLTVTESMLTMKDNQYTTNKTATVRFGFDTEGINIWNFESVFYVDNKLLLQTTGSVDTTILTIQAEKLLKMKGNYFNSKADNSNRIELLGAFRDTGDVRPIPQLTAAIDDNYSVAFPVTQGASFTSQLRVAVIGSGITQI